MVNQLIRAEAIGLVICGIFLLIGCLSVFYFAKNKAKEYIFLAIGAFSIAIYTFYITQWRYILGVELIYDFRLFYAASFSAVPAFVRFTYESLYDRNTEKERKWRNCLITFLKG